MRVGGDFLQPLGQSGSYGGRGRDLCGSCGRGCVGFGALGLYVPVLGAIQDGIRRFRGYPFCKQRPCSKGLVAQLESLDKLTAMNASGAWATRPSAGVASGGRR